MLLKEILTLIDYAIPENVESVSAVDAEKVAGYMERVKNQFAVEMETYFSPESLVKGITPTGIVLAFGTVGSFFGGPLGFAAGGVIGNIFAKNSKPDAAHNAVGEKFSTQDTDSDIDNL